MQFLFFFTISSPAICGSAMTEKWTLASKTRAGGGTKGRTDCSLVSCGILMDFVGFCWNFFGSAAGDGGKRLEPDI